MQKQGKELRQQARQEGGCCLCLRRLGRRNRRLWLRRRCYSSKHHYCLCHSTGRAVYAVPFRLQQLAQRSAAALGPPSLPSRRLLLHSASSTSKQHAKGAKERSCQGLTQGLTIMALVGGSLVAAWAPPPSLAAATGDAAAVAAAAPAAALTLILGLTTATMTTTANASTTNGTQGTGRGSEGGIVTPRGGSQTQGSAPGSEIGTERGTTGRASVTAAATMSASVTAASRSVALGSSSAVAVMQDAAVTRGAGTGERRHPAAPAGGLALLAAAIEAGARDIFFELESIYSSKSSEPGCRAR